MLGFKVHHLRIHEEFSICWISSGPYRIRIAWFWGIDLGSLFFCRGAYSLDFLVAWTESKATTHRKELHLCTT